MNRTIRDRRDLIDELINYHKDLFKEHSNMVELIKSDEFLKAPASTKYHGSYEGGLFDHSYNVAITLAKLTIDNSLSWERKESPYIIGFLHDLCKIDNYIPDSEFPYIYNKETLYKGHGVKSILLASSYETLTEEEVACIVYHMGAFTEKEEWADYTRAIHQFPNVLWTHQADMIAAHILEI